MADDTQYQPLLNELGWTLCAIAVVVVGARIYGRAVIAGTRTWDDCFMVLALIAGIIMMALVSAGIDRGYGLHLEDIHNPSDREQALMYTYVAPTISILASTLGKTSMVLFIVRLLGQSVRRVQLWLLYSVTGIMVGANILTVGILLGGCTPIHKSWKPEVPGSCIPPNVYDYVGRAQSSWNAFVDLATAAFPAYMVWRLQLKRSTKWSLTFLMCGGVFAAAATFTKIWYMRNISKLTDITYAWAPISLCYIAEVFILVILGSLPTLKPIINVCRGWGLLDNRLFAMLYNQNSEPTTTFRYGGTTLASTNGWELPNIEESRRRDSLENLTALPTLHERPEMREVPLSSTASAPSRDSESQLRRSLGPITVQQDFNLAYERSPRDSMSLDSSERER
ncbi:hypothetical protein OPT61_g976 [Boeremia exigua]|uniref:Uncharacterized protein n=1 Tax=Boeremia exigua TaxID=749465 RepID=A0ACC2IRY9_9PLEO|nr:hypothetical protein OPT61_g976 [Boeremia exigua]